MCGIPDVNIFSEEKECFYKDRSYLVRDNGAVYLRRKGDSAIKRHEEQWTFGRLGKRGYLYIGNERVHRIVCTAFHGEPVGERNIVDHFDTNRRNNRSSNLRWVTRFENMLNNPITLAKIETVCGSLEAFLKNPSLLYGHESAHKSFSWMREVDPEEAQNSLDNWLEWASKPLSERLSSGGRKGPGEWIYNRDNRPIAGDSLTPSAKQIGLYTRTLFPLCPSGKSVFEYEEYMLNLSKGGVFAKGKVTVYGDVYQYGFNGHYICVITCNQQVLSSGVGRPWCFFTIKLSLDKDYFIHELVTRTAIGDVALRDYCRYMGIRYEGRSVEDWIEGF